MDEFKVRGEDSGVLSQLTITIVTKGRPGRAVSKALFWSRLGCAVNIFDASEFPEVVLDHAGVTYSHEPDVSFAARLSEAASLISTPYAMIQSDDDVFLPEALKSMITSLEKDSEAVGVSGVAITVQRSGLGPVLVRAGTHAALERVRITASPKGRLENHMRSYFPSVIYGVVRADVFNMVASGLRNLQDGANGIEELFFEMGVHGTGRVLALPEIFWIRNPLVPSHDSSLAQRRRRERATPWFLQPYSKEYRSFVRELSTVFESSLGTIPAEGAELAKGGIEAYSAFFLAGRTFPSGRPVKVWERLTSEPGRRWMERLGTGFSFLRNFTLALVFPSRRVFHNGFMQPPFTFVREAAKVGVEVHKATFLRTVKSMR